MSEARCLIRGSISESDSPLCVQFAELPKDIDEFFHGAYPSL